MDFLKSLSEEQVKIMLQAVKEISSASNSGRELHFLSPKELEEMNRELTLELSKRNNADTAE